MIESNFEARANNEFAKRHYALAVKTDQMFGALFLFQWMLGIVFAYWISPRTWTGEFSQPHIHLYAAVLVGGLIASLPIYLILHKPGATLNRMVIAASQIFFSILLIHLTGGRIETHFHIFGSLAFLAFYRDWRVVLVGTVITAADHLVRGYFWPQSVYGVLAAGPWRAIEHAAWVVFEDIVLFYSIKLALGELKAASESQIKLQDTIASVEDQVLVRTKELQESQRIIIEQQQAMISASKMSALGEMAGGVAHEINNPLAVIKSYSGQLQEVIDDASFDKLLVKQMAAQIEKTTDRIAHIVQGLRTFSRDGSNDNFQLVKTGHLIEETLSFCSERFKNNGIILTIDPYDRSLNFEGRETEISQVLLNLLNNAHDAIAQLKERWIKISIIDAQSSILLQITDSGSGVPLQFQEKIFQPFFTTKEIGKGTGMGLSISAGIVKKHKGELMLDTACKNTRFTIRLPKKQFSEAA